MATNKIPNASTIKTIHAVSSAHDVKAGSLTEESGGYSWVDSSGNKHYLLDNGVVASTV